jgi:hypothetical protein
MSFESVTSLMMASGPMAKAFCSALVLARLSSRSPTATIGRTGALAVSDRPPPMNARASASLKSRSSTFPFVL